MDRVSFFFRCFKMALPHWRRVLRWSYIQTAAIRIGDEILEVTGGDHPKFWVNGVDGSNDGVIVFSSLGLKVDVTGFETGNHTRVRIDLLNADAIAFETVKDFVRVTVHQVDSKWNKFTTARGLMGSYPSGVTLARDGITVMEDTNAFAQEWQVLSTERALFRVVEGPQHPTKCIMPTDIPTDLRMSRRRLEESMITPQDAELACSHVMNDDERNACIVDVLATNDKDIAIAY